MSEHSSTPWRYGNTGPEQVMILGDNGSYVCSVQIKQTGGGFIASAMEPERQANAAFIVKCVNSHDAMKASLAEMIGIYWGDGDGHEPPPQCIQRAMAALASIKERA